MAARSKSSNIFVWIILILLIAGLAGFGIGGLGGTISRIGAVGETEIGVEDYQRALQQEINFETRRQQQPISFLQATQQGLDLRVRTNLAATAALTEEARVVGLSVGDDEVANQLRNVPAFQGAAGSFDREVYEFTLQQNGLRAQEFEEQLRTTAARELLQQAVTSGVTANPTYAETLFTFIGERRSFRWAEIGEELLVTPSPAPTDAQISAFYEESSEQFLRPEIRRLTYVWLTPDMLVEEIAVDDAELRAIYEERSAEYRQPERRIMERLSFPDLAAAEQAKTDIEGGAATFEGLVTDRGLTLDDVDMGVVSRDDLDSAVAEAAFAATEPGLVGPVETSLGPTLFRINAVLEATETPFEDARDDLLRETTTDRARREIEDRITEIDDLLAGGAELEEIAQETPMQLGEIDFSEEITEGIASYASFREEVAQLSENDFAEIREMSDGGIFAVRLDEIVPPALPPLDEIRGDVADAWSANETRIRLRELAENLRDQMESGVAMEALGLTATTETDVTRTTFVEDAPVGIAITVFEAEPNGTAVFENDEGVALVEVINVSPPDRSSPDLSLVLERLNEQSSASLAADIFELFGQSVQTRHGLQLDQAAINAVHQSFAGTGGF